MSAAPLVATTADGPGRGRPGGTNSRGTARECEPEDPFPRGMRGNFRDAATRDTKEERLDDCWVDAVELLVLKRSHGRSDVDSGSEGGFLRLGPFRCVFEPRRRDSLNGEQSLRPLLVIAECSGENLGKPVVG